MRQAVRRLRRRRARNRPEWRAAERALWEEAAALDPGDGPALRSFHDEGVRSLEIFGVIRRVMANTAGELGTFRGEVRDRLVEVLAHQRHSNRWSVDPRSPSYSQELGWTPNSLRPLLDHPAAAGVGPKHLPYVAEEGWAASGSSA